jgi:hypothetical protein
MKKLWTARGENLLYGIAMHTPSGTSPGGDFVNFNGLCVERSSIPTLVQFLVQSDPMTVPSGEGLEPERRETVSRIFRRSFQSDNSEPTLLSALGGEGEALRYLTGLMASRF